MYIAAAVGEQTMSLLSILFIPLAHVYKNIVDSQLGNWRCNYETFNYFDRMMILTNVRSILHIFIPTINPSQLAVFRSSKRSL